METATEAEVESSDAIENGESTQDVCAGGSQSSALDTFTMLKGQITTSYATWKSN